MNPIDTPKTITAAGNAISNIIGNPSFFKTVVLLGLFMLIFYITPFLAMGGWWAHQTDRIVEAIKENCSNRLAGRSKVLVPTE